MGTAETYHSLRESRGDKGKNNDAAISWCRLDDCLDLVNGARERKALKVDGRRAELNQDRRQNRLGGGAGCIGNDGNGQQIGQGASGAAGIRIGSWVLLSMTEA